MEWIRLYEYALISPHPSHFVLPFSIVRDSTSGSLDTVHLSPHLFPNPLLITDRQASE
jgi:hypothetical protein